MTLLNKIPGTVLVILGALCLSFGGIIVKSFEGANLWQILFWRQTFFSIIVALYLLITFKKNFFKSFHTSGLPGLIAGIFLGIGFSAYVFAMYHTTVANTLFIISTETIFLALFGYIFLKEKINLVTLISIIMGMSGVLLIIGSSLSIQSSSQFFGNIVAFIMPISFAVLIVIVRKYPKVDMVPSQFIAGSFCCFNWIFSCWQIIYFISRSIFRIFSRNFSNWFWIYNDYHWISNHSCCCSRYFNVNRSSFWTTVGLAFYK